MADELIVTTTGGQKFDLNNPEVKKVFGIDDETSARMHAAWEAAPIEWHDEPTKRREYAPDSPSCAGRHGVIRGVAKDRWQETQRMIEWFMGSNACRWTKEPGGTYAVEFVHMTKVYPAPTKPWEWCGQTVLFGDWKAKVEATRAAVQTFRVGQQVSFAARGTTKRGLVMSVNEKTVSVLVENEGRWRVSPNLLTKES